MWRGKILFIWRYYDYMSENPKKMQKLNKIFNHGTGYKINLQKSINFIYTNKNQLEDIMKKRT